MAHWNLVVGYDSQSGPRGDDAVTSVNWLMLMARHSLAAGELTARVMLSAEPLTATARGYPLLLQTGESFQGEPLHDRQHPHDLFMEVAAIYTREITFGLGVQLYVAPAGEPALGPVAFPHRGSAASDPFAPLGHHWQDSTHISFGVLTAGIFSRSVKLEGSWFNGREPDERRYDFDLRVPDSFALRISINPFTALSFQASYGHLRSPELLDPQISVDRIVASVTYNHRFLSEGMWIATFIWGRNLESGLSPSDAFTLESDVDFNGRDHFFARLEYLRKSGHDLALGFGDDRLFGIGSLAGGYLREFGAFASVLPGLGIRASVNAVSDELRPLYGTNFPAGVMVFFRLRPEPMERAHAH